MAPRRRSSGLPLEWRTIDQRVTDNTVTGGAEGEIDLDLLPDEIAEIVMIDSNIKITEILPDPPVDQLNQLAMYLSMDPDAIASPVGDDNVEDLEIFFTHYFNKYTSDATTETNLEGVFSHDKFVDFSKYPILVGTNLGQVVIGSATLNVSFVTTVYFKRRKASASELNQILLKRR